MRRTFAPAALLLAFAAGAALAEDAPGESVRPAEDPIAALEARAKAATGDARAAAWSDLARALEAAGRNVEAAGAWRQSGSASPSAEAAAGEGRALLAFAEEVLASGDAGASIRAAFEDARRALDKARALGAKDSAIALGLARCAAAEGRADEEIALLRAACEAFPDDPAPPRALAFAFLNAGRWAEALPRFRALSDATPSDVRLSLCLAASARATGDEPLAIAAAERTIEHHPSDRRGWEALWQVYAPQRRWGELADRLKTLAEARSGVAICAHYAGFAALNAQRTDDALAFLEKAWTLDPRDVGAKLEAARALLTARRDRDGAEKLAAEVLRGDPANVRASDLLAYIGLRRSEDGDHEGAVRALETIVEVRPDDVVALANLGLERRWAGRYEASEEAYRRALALAPADPQVHNDFGLLLLVLGRVEEARRTFLAGHEADPEANDVMENLAWLARERGDLAEASRWHRLAYEAALRRGGDGARHRRNLDDARWPLPPVRFAR